MAPDLRKLKDKAFELAGKSKFKKAAETYRMILKANPRDAVSRQKLAENLRKMGKREEAIAEYQQVADTYAQDGLLIKAIAVCKVILEIDPDHSDTQQALADFYARKLGPVPTSASTARSPEPHLPPLAQQILADLYARKPGLVPPDVPDVDACGYDATVSSAALSTTFSPSLLRADDVSELPPELDPTLSIEGKTATAFETMVETAQQARESGVEQGIAIAIDESLPELPTEALPPARPHIPLFSDLSSAAFQALTDRLELKRFAPGDEVIRQGEPGESFYVIASGLFRVVKTSEAEKPVTVALLEDGAFFGEMALLSGEPRAASVFAETEGELLEIRADTLTALCREYPHVADSVARFYRHRLLCNAMATSPLFRPFSHKERKEIMLQFRTRRVETGQRVITEGQLSDGLYLVLSGSLAVLKVKESAQILAGELREGDVFGEMSCLRKTPASATVVARRSSVLLRLPRNQFDTLIVTYPQILELVANLTDQRQRKLDHLNVEREGWAEEVILV